MDVIVAEPGVAPEARDSLTAKELEAALDYLFSHKMAFVQDFLRDRDLAFSGTKDRLRERVEEYLAAGNVSPPEIVRLLDQIEGWGNQHIYLYQAPDPLIRPWLHKDSARALLRGAGLESYFQRRLPLVSPPEIGLSSIDWTPERVRFLWVETREWEERVPDEDYVEDGIVYHAYRLRSARGLTAFDWDLIGGGAMLMIQRLPSGTRYGEVQARFEEILEPVVAIRQFDRVRVSRAIKPVERSGEVRRRQVAYETRRGGKAAFTSPSRTRGVDSDPILQDALDEVQQDSAGVLGNFYWLPVNGGPGCEVHCKLYATDQRIGIFGEHEERDVRYVLSRIRFHCG